MGQYFTIAGLMFLLERALTTVAPVSFTGDTTSSSTSVATVSSTTGLAVGQVILGAGIPAGTTIASIGSGTITLSQAATATATGVDLFAFGANGLLSDLSLHLLTGVILQSPTTNWTDLTEANYDGYAAVVLSSGFFNVSAPKTGFVVAAATCQNFTPTDYTVPNTITGMAWTYPGAGSSGPQLIATEIFTTPINLSASGDAIQVIPVLSFANDETAGQPSPIL